MYIDTCRDAVYSDFTISFGGVLSAYSVRVESVCVRVCVCVCVCVYVCVGGHVCMCTCVYKHVLYKQKYWQTLYLAVCSENAVGGILNW